MKDENHRTSQTHKLIILRGNSGSGKTTIAKELQKVFGRNTMIISQDVVLRLKTGKIQKPYPC